MSVVVNAEYKTFLKGIKERIHKAQYDAFKSVNKELINLYWDIGRSIVYSAPSRPVILEQVDH